jgi:hypothetical protein
MNVGLQVAYLWHDIHALELRVTAENAEFRGTADVYVGADALLEAATTLAGFPRNHLDKREVVFGAAGKNFAGEAARLEFYCKDMAGHAAFRATIEGDYGDQKVAESATVCVDFEIYESFVAQPSLTQRMTSLPEEFGAQSKLEELNGGRGEGEGHDTYPPLSRSAEGPTQSCRRNLGRRW